MNRPPVTAIPYSASGRFRGRRLATTLSSKIVASVRQGLFDGTFAPGGMLGTERQVADEFGVSRVAARDALQRLEAMGVVEIRAGAGGGARIARGNPQLFADALAVQLRLTNASAAAILDAQRAIEMMTAELAAEHATADDLAAIAGLLLQADNALGDTASFTKASFAFHLAVADAAHNEVLKMQLEAMHFIAWPSHNPMLTATAAAHIQDVHRTLYERIEVRDGDGARALMSQHIMQIRARRTADSAVEDAAGHCC